MWDNKYQRYFKGHVQEVTTLAMNPKNDMLLSGARVSSEAGALPGCVAWQPACCGIQGGAVACFQQCCQQGLILLSVVI